MEVLVFLLISVKFLNKNSMLKEKKKKMNKCINHKANPGYDKLWDNT